MIAAAAGAAGSLTLMLDVGRRNESRILLTLFAIWVLSPFAAAYGLARLVPAARTMLYGVMLFLALASPAIYGAVAFWRPAKPAAAFLLVPLASWLMLVAGVAIAKSRAR